MRRREAGEIFAVLPRSDSAGDFHEDRGEWMSSVDIHTEFVVAATLDLSRPPGVMRGDESWQLWVESMLSGVLDGFFLFECDEQIAMDGHEAMGVQRRVAALSITVSKVESLRDCRLSAVMEMG